MSKIKIEIKTYLIFGEGECFMNNQFIAISKVHEYLVDKEISNESLEDRVIIQKVIYLAQCRGVECGNFKFSWYKKGPYSPALTKVVYDNMNDFEGEKLVDFQLNKSAIRRLSSTKEVIKHRDNTLSEADWIELLGSLVYLLEDSDDQKSVIKDLIRQKPKYSVPQVKNAISKLEKYELL